MQICKRCLVREMNRETMHVIVLYDGTKEWHFQGSHLENGQHREDGPAVVTANGNQVWWLHDKIHREDGPAVVTANGNQVWWLHESHLENGQHREDGPAFIKANGDQIWYFMENFIEWVDQLS